MAAFKKVLSWFNTNSSDKLVTSKIFIEPAVISSLEDGEVSTEKIENLEKGQSQWIQWLTTCMRFSTAFRELPFAVVWDAKLQRYTVKTSVIRKGICILFRIFGAIVFWTEVADMVHKIQTSGDNYQHFDLLFSLGWLVFDYPVLYIWMFRMDRIQEFFDELQDTPLLKIASPRSYWLCIPCALGALWYQSVTFMFIPTRWEVFDLSLQSYYGVLQSACEVHLKIPKSSESQVWYPAAILFTFIITTFQYNSLLCRDMLSVSSVLTMRNISVDFERAMQRGTIPEEGMFEMLLAYKKLTRKFNRSLGLLVCIYIVYASPYYSLHFVDMVEVPGLMNRLSMLTFIIPLGFACKWTLDILVKSKRRKRWFSRQNRLMNLDRERINILLDDIVWEKFALGSYYQVNPYVVGQVFSLLATTVAIVRIQSMAEA